MAVHAYDAADRRISTTDIDGNITRFQYDEVGNLIRTMDANGHTTRYEYDAMNRRTVVIDANGHRTRTAYDLAGNVIRITDANGHATAFGYDAAGRHISITTPLGNQTFTGFDANGSITHIIDANAVAGTQPRNSQGASISRQYDEMNRLVRMIDAQNGETLYRYDLLGNLTAITDAEGRTTTFVYDDLGRLIQTIDPLVETPSDKTVTLTHDQMGNVLTRTDREGQTIHYTYDAANRLVLTQYLADGMADAWETRQYDHYGNLVNLSNGEITYTYTYDNHNRLETKTDTRQTGAGSVSRTLQFHYDPAGNLIRKTDYQGEVTHFQYDSTNRLVALTNKDYLQVSYHYDGAGRLLDRILSNGVKTRYAYDQDNRLVELTNSTANGQVIHAQHFQYDRMGNITKITDQNGETITYTYDPRYRLIGVDAPGTENDQNFTYDGVGNRVMQETATQTLHYLYDAGNRLQEVRLGSETGPMVASYRYDDNGSRTSMHDTAGNLVQAYQYDPKRRIRRLTQGSGVVHTYAYDPNDYRVRRVTPQGTRHYLLQAEHLEAIYDDNNQLEAKYLRGVVVDEIVNGYEYPDAGNQKTRVNLSFHHDHNKSVVGLSAHEGSILETIGYEAFGDVAGSTGTSDNRLRYTGREQDADTGLYYYRARYYDPAVGRFLTEDPLGFQAGINFYRYVENNPVNFNDPSGMESLITDSGFAGLSTNPNPSSRELLFAAGMTVAPLAPFAIKAAIPSVVGAVKSLSTPGIIAGTGGVVGHVATTEKVTLGSGAKSFAVGYVGGSIMGPAFGSVASKFIANPLTSNLVANTTNAASGSVLGQLALGGSVDPVGVGISMLSAIPSTLFLSEVATSGIAAATAHSIAGEAISTGYSIIGSRFASSLQRLGSNGASGGFALYPNKPNSNMMQTVYAK